MFKSDLNPINFYILKKQYWKKINDKNIESLKFSYVKKIFAEDLEILPRYLYKVVGIWYKNLDSPEDNINKIKKLIKRFKLNLTIIDKHDLQILEERYFSNIRHIKNLEFDINRMRKESFGIKFQDADLLKDDEKLVLITSGILLISNKRIVVRSESDIEFKWINITNKTFNEYGFTFEHGKEKYTLRIHDQPTLNNTIKNLIHKRMK